MRFAHTRRGANAGDRGDERSTGLGTYRSKVGWSCRSRHDDFASPLHWRFLPRDAHDGSSLIVLGTGRIAADPATAGSSTPAGRDHSRIAELVAALASGRG